MSDLFGLILSGDVSSVEKGLHDDPGSIRRVSPTGFTPLIMAVQEDNEAIVELLLREGADVNQSADIKSIASGRIQKGILPLMFCESEGVVELLLRFGANPGLRDSKGWTAFMHCCMSLNIGMVERVLSAGYAPSEEEIRTLLNFIRDEIKSRNSMGPTSGGRLGRLISFSSWAENRFFDSHVIFDVWPVR